MLISALASANYQQLSKNYGFAEMDIIKLDYGIHSLVIEDFNNDKLLDIAIVNNHKNVIEIFLQKKDANTQSDSLFSDYEDIDINELAKSKNFENQQILVNTKIYNLVSGDFNSDGLTDLAYYGKPNGLYIIIQKKSDNDKLSWNSSRKIKIKDGLKYRNSIIAADINNDSQTDIILAGEKYIYILAQMDKNIFRQPIKYPTATKPIRIMVTDLNKDKLQDLIFTTTDRDFPLKIRFGKADKQLGPINDVFIDKPWHITTAQINDTKNIVLATDPQSGRLRCYQYQNSKENGDKDRLPMQIYPLAAGQGSKRDIAVAKLTGNSNLEIVISEPESAEIILYQQDKPLSPSKPIRFPSLAKINEIQVADLDNDKIDELVILSIEEKALAISKYQDGRITFPEPIDINDQPMAFTLIKNKKSVDCFYIARDKDNAYYFNTINKLGSKNPLTAKIKLKLKDIQSNPQGIKAFDADGNGLFDAIIFVNQYTPPIFIYQKTQGVFEVIKTPSSRISLLQKATFAGTQITDIDNDKKTELLIASNNYARALIFTDGQWKVKDQFNANSNENTITAALFEDFDNDGKRDILLFDGPHGLMQLLKIQEDGTYRFEKEFETSKWQIKKLISCQLSKKAKAILLFDGEKFAIISQHIDAIKFNEIFNYATKIKDGRYAIVEVGDINNDNKMDIVLVEYAKNHIEILTLDDDYQPQDAFRFKVFEHKSYLRETGKSSVEPHQIEIADITGDAKNDLIVVIHDKIIIYPAE